MLGAVGAGRRSWAGGFIRDKLWFYGSFRRRRATSFDALGSVLKPDGTLAGEHQHAPVRHREVS
jgi:hypothetical protein